MLSEEERNLLRENTTSHKNKTVIFFSYIFVSEIVSDGIATLLVT